MRDGDFERSLPHGAHSAILKGWAVLGLVALALAGFALIMPALSKMPGLERAVDWPADFFQKGLVAHVALSFIVWFLTVVAIVALTALRLPDRRDSALPGGLGLALAAVGTLAIATAPFSGGAPSLNNYVPTIIHPLYFAGLGAVAAGTLMPVVQMLPRLIAADETAPGGERTALLALGLLFIAALTAIAVAAHQLAAPPVDYDTIERLFWGGGHLLQFVNVALFLVAIERLGGLAVDNSAVGERAAAWSAGTLFLAGAAGLATYGLTDIHEAAHLRAFTDLQYAFAVPVLIALAGALTGRRRWRMAHDRVATLGLALAALVFLYGAALGLFVDGSDTRTPAHYHGVIGGINIALYGLFYREVLPVLGARPPKQRLALAQIIVYALGQTMFITGLFVAGGMGAARKSMGSGLEGGGIAQFVALALRDCGLLLAVVSSAMFIVITLTALLRKPAQS